MTTTSKWATVGVAAGAIVGVAALGGAWAYFSFKDEEDFKRNHVSSRPISIDVQIAQQHAGIVIGRGGQTIKEIQSKSSTKINFKDELATEKFRILSISGLPDDVKLAEILVNQTIANQPTLERMEMQIPSVYIGRIIGRNGETIRSLQDRSRCRIDIERRPFNDGKSFLIYLFLNATCNMHRVASFNILSVQIYL